MHFAYPLPWWLAVLLAAAVGAAAYADRGTSAVAAHTVSADGLVSLRVLTLTALVCSCSGRLRFSAQRFP